MKYKYGVVHGLAECLDCDWEAKSYKNAQATSKIHAQKYRHKVAGELGVMFEYNGKENNALRKP